ncbi:hypothetical protein, partial [Paenibacillus xylanexedens]|uniref:hypothetical protein n=1 Tax=Paenibacillus xylanexedens TaxID=528191 RepID=UPI001C92E5B9
SAGRMIVRPFKWVGSRRKRSVSNGKGRREKKDEGLGCFLGLLVGVKSSNVGLFGIKRNVKSEMEKNNKRKGGMVMRMGLRGK